MVGIGVVGDHQPTNETHLATTASLHHAGEAAGLDLEVAWVPTPEVELGQGALLGSFDALVIAPGSPYESMDGALAAIRAARTADVPLLATCGGFQHVILEFARNVLGVTDAHHAEYDPCGSQLFITPLSCSLAGQQMAIRLHPDTVAARAYRSLAATERYYCNFGLNPDYLHPLIAGGLVVSGVDDDDEVRVVELSPPPLLRGDLVRPPDLQQPRAPAPARQCAGPRRSPRRHALTSLGGTALSSGWVPRSTQPEHVTTVHWTIPDRAAPTDSWLGPRARPD